MSTHLEIIQIPALEDNYIYIVGDSERNECIVIDPTVAKPVLKQIRQRGWNLTAVYNTHHHEDHVEGNELLRKETGCLIIASEIDARKIAHVDGTIDGGEAFFVGRHMGQIISTPGHTLGHISLWFDDDNALFCGDALFALGTGRVFEGTMEQTWDSMRSFKVLPDRTRIFCAHEYTEVNARFTLEQDPNNSYLLGRYKQIIEKRKLNLPTIPTLMREEKKTNIFLRANDKSLKQIHGLEHLSDVGFFKIMRERRNKF